MRKVYGTLIIPSILCLLFLFAFVAGLKINHYLWSFAFFAGVGVLISLREVFNPAWTYDEAGFERKIYLSWFAVAYKTKPSSWVEVQSIKYSPESLGYLVSATDKNSVTISSLFTAEYLKVLYDVANHVQKKNPASIDPRIWDELKIFERDYCVSCGTKKLAGKRFCGKCGSDLETSQPVQSSAS
jgi:hypothetical protein